MVDKNLNDLDERLNAALDQLKSVARQYYVGTKIKFDGKFGVVTGLSQGSADPDGRTVDIRLEDGSIVEGVSVTTKALEFYRA